MSPTATSGTRMDTGEDLKPMATIRLGMRYSPELREGLGLTLLLAVIASCGQIVVPIVVQQTLDRGLNAPDGPRLDLDDSGVTSSTELSTGRYEVSGNHLSLAADLALDGMRAGSADLEIDCGG